MNAFAQSRALSRPGLLAILSVLLMLVLIATPLSAGAQDDGVEEPTEVVALDPDGDGLSDEEELEIGADPKLFDTDADGLSDGSEVREDGWGTDPLSNDTDGDGFLDGDEIIRFETDPNDPESKPADIGTSTFNIEVRVLPVGYDGDDIPGDSAPLSNVEVTVAIPYSEFGVTMPTDPDGRAVFHGLGEGEYWVILHIPGDAADFVTVFGTDDGFEPRQHDGQDTNETTVYLGPDEVVNGTFYVLPVDAGADPDPTAPAPTEPAKTPTPTPTPVPVKALPNTGAGDMDSGGTLGPIYGVALILLLVFGGIVLRRRTT